MCVLAFVTIKFSKQHSLNGTLHKVTYLYFFRTKIISIICQCPLILVLIMIAANSIIMEHHVVTEFLNQRLKNSWPGNAGPERLPARSSDLLNIVENFVVLFSSAMNFYRKINRAILILCWGSNLPQFF